MVGLCFGVKGSGKDQEERKKTQQIMRIQDQRKGEKMRGKKHKLSQKGRRKNLTKMKV